MLVCYTGTPACSGQVLRIQYPLPLIILDTRVWCVSDGSDNMCILVTMCVW